MTLLDALQSHGEMQPDRVALTFLASNEQRNVLTYRQLHKRVRSLAAALSQQANFGDRALLMYSPGLEFVVSFLACLMAGVVAVPAYPPRRNRNADRVGAICSDCTPRLLLTDRASVDAVRHTLSAESQQLSIILTEEIPSADNSPWQSPAILDASIAFLQYTSGSTRSPKGVMVSHANIVANELAIQGNFGHSRDSVMVSWLPMFHDMGLIGGVLQPLFVGFPSVLMAPNAFLREPVLWLQAITEFRGTTAGGPNFAYDLCSQKITAEQKRALDLSTWETAYNGAEPVRAQTLDRFFLSFAECGFRSSAAFPCYGLAEATLFVSGGPKLVEPRIVLLDS